MFARCELLMVSLSYMSTPLYLIRLHIPTAPAPNVWHGTPMVNSGVPRQRQLSGRRRTWHQDPMTTIHHHHPPPMNATAHHHPPDALLESSWNQSPCHPQIIHVTCQHIRWPIFLNASHVPHTPKSRPQLMQVAHRQKMRAYTSACQCIWHCRSSC